ncbi:MAG: type II toxin-antitoxin system RelB/DinJ family antitoxin [Clostridium sp.]|nr:type II toxin-antitoxin system RelB/DinJ family antitoxin [Clostridium sp.]
MANVNVTIRMDEDVKRQADDLFSDLGMSLSGAITIFMKQAIRQQAIPFKIARDVPNQETLEAIEEVKRLKNDPMKKVYNSFDEILEELNNEI